MSDLIDISEDFETYSELDVTDVRPWAYSIHPSTEVISYAYAVGDGPVQLWLPGMPLPGQVLEPHKYRWNAFNAFFEFVIKANVLGWPLPPIANISCTRSLALAMALPRNLGDLGRVLGLPGDKQKDKRGKKLIQLLCKPQTKGRGKTKERYRNRDPELYQEFYQYNMQDVVTEREAKKYLLPLQPEERVTWELDFLINLRGIPLDIDFIEAADVVYQKAKPKLAKNLAAITGLANPNSNPQFLAWLQDRGYQVANVKKATLEELKLTATPEDAAIIDKRISLARSPSTKYKAAFEKKGLYNRFHGAYDFHKANTGRFASTVVNFQNLPHPSLAQGDIETCISLIKDYRDDEILTTLYGDPIEALSSCLRGMVYASEGNKLIVADFKSIEAGVLAWLAGQLDKIEIFNTHGKVYEHAASLIFNIALDAVNYTQRQAGKVSELACGYQGGVNALTGMAKKLGIDLDKSAAELGYGSGFEFAASIVKKWRQANSNIVDLWYASDRTAHRAMQYPGVHPVNDKIAFERWRDFLLMWLPSGRRLSFKDPHFTAGKYGPQISCYRVNDKGQWALHNLYGGDEVQSATQAIARDLLTAAMPRLEHRGYTLVGHTHDELISEVPIGFGSLKEMIAIMCQPTSWSAGIPIDADGFEARRYQKG